MKKLLLLLCIISISSLLWADDIFSGTTPINPSSGLLDQSSIILGIIAPLMVTMVVLAAAVYLGGQMFGAETRAKASVWAQSMLVGVAIGAGILAMLYIILPSFLSGVGPSSNLENLLHEIVNSAETTVAVIIMVMVVLAGLCYAIGQWAGADTRAKAAALGNNLLTGAVFVSILYVVLFQLIFSSNTLSFFFQTSVTGMSLYASLIINIVFLTSLVILVTYAISKFLKVPEWEAYLNIELSNLMTSFLVVIFVVGFFAAADIFVRYYTDGIATTPPQAAIKFMQGTVADSVLKGLYDVYEVQACTSVLNTFSRRIGEAVLTQSYKIFPGIDTFVSITNVLGAGLVTIYASVSAQVSLLYLFDSTMVHFFLPAGLILRFFPPTRDAGAFLIAVAFGAEFVFPLTYIINKNILTDIGLGPYESPRVLMASICGPFKYGAWGYLLSTNNPIFNNIPGGANVANYLAAIMSESTLNGISMSEFIPIMSNVASLSLPALFMPALSMMITVAFINSTSKFISSRV